MGASRRPYHALLKIAINLRVKSHRTCPISRHYIQCIPFLFTCMEVYTMETQMSNLGKERPFPPMPIKRTFLLQLLCALSVSKNPKYCSICIELHPSARAYKITRTTARTAAEHGGQQPQHSATQANRTSPCAARWKSH